MGVQVRGCTGWMSRSKGPMKVESCHQTIFMGRVTGVKGVQSQEMSNRSSSEGEGPVGRSGNAFGLLQDARSSDSESSVASVKDDDHESDTSFEANRDQVEMDIPDSDDEFAELERQYSANLQANVETRSQASLIDANWLDPSVELRRKFSGKNHSRLEPKPFNGRLVPTLNKKWRPFSPESVGLKMVREDGGDQFYYQDSAEYSEQYDEFEALIALGDISLVAEFLKMHPNNPDALLCLADASARFGIPAQGMTPIDLCQRIIQIMERLYHPEFKLLDHRLPYGHLHNRKFHLVLFSYVQALIRQGCWRTALQVATALRSLDDDDPLGTDLFIEFLKAQCKEDVENSFNKLLAMHSTELFAEYAKRDPWMIGELAGALGIDRSVTVTDLLADNIPNAAIQLRAKLFAARSAPLWKADSHLRWFKNQLEQTALDARESTMTWGEAIRVYRHAILSDLKVKFSLPREIAIAIGGSISSHDPIPPEDLELSAQGGSSIVEQARTLFRQFFR